MKGIIIGSGAYVTGRNSSGSGTILASVMQYGADTGNIDSVIVTSPSESSRLAVDQKVSELNSRLNADVKVGFERLENEEWLLNKIRSEHFDFAMICVPDHLHSGYIRIFVEHGVAVLVVKPFTDDYSDAVQLTSLAREKGVYGAVEFHKRWDESNLYLKRRLTENALGKVLYFDVNYSQRIVIPTETFKGWASKSNIFQYLGVHYVDLIYFITGYKPTSLSVNGIRKKLQKLGVDTWDAVLVSSVWTSDDGQDHFHANFHLNWVDPNSTTAMSDQRILCVGEDGRIECDQKHRGVVEVVSDGTKDINPYFSEWILNENGDQRLNGYGFKSIDQFLHDAQALKGGDRTVQELQDSRPSFKDSLVSMKFIDMVNQQLKNENIQWEKITW